MRKYLLVFVGIFMISPLFVAPQTVSACSPTNPPTPKEKLKEADAVFSGKVLFVEEKITEPNKKEFTAVILVDEYWKGDVPQYIQFISSTFYSTGPDIMMNCSFGFIPKVGKEYLIYSNYSESKNVYERIGFWYETELTDSNRANNKDLDFLDDGEEPEVMQNPFPINAQETFPMSTYIFDRNLSLGMSHDSVRGLQMRLNKMGYTIAVSGPGSVGNETTYFGPATKAALIKYQNDYLVALGITQGTGYFGPLTRNLLSNLVIE